MGCWNHEKVNGRQNLSIDQRPNRSLASLKKLIMVTYEYSYKTLTLFEEFDGYGRGAILSITSLMFLCFHLYPEDIPSLSITVTSQLQSGGMGSSAAYSSALSAAILSDSGHIEVTVFINFSFLCFSSMFENCSKFLTITTNTLMIRSSRSISMPGM